MIAPFISQITSEDQLVRYEQVLTHMSPPRKIRAMRLLRSEDKIRMLKAEWLVKSAIAEMFSLPFSSLKIENDGQGKPYCLHHKELHLSLAHAGQYVVCAVASCPVGVDIEQTRPIDFSIARRFFSPLEQNYIFSSAAPQKLNRFYEVWTLKESYIKAIGQGLSKSLSSFSVILRDNAIGLLDDCPGPFYFCQYELPPPYQMAVCSMTDNGFQRLKWREFPP